MEVSFGDFQPNELYNLIENKDPLGLNNDTEGQKTQQIEQYDAIPHYIKMASTIQATNINNNANSNPGSEDKEILTQVSSLGPSQVNPSTSNNITNTKNTGNNPYNTQLASQSSDNLSQKVSFKSFENLQSHKRSCTNSHDETSDVSGPESNNLSNSNELLDQFNTRTKEIIEGLHELHFSTIDLRNKLNSGRDNRVNNGHPIITQVTGRNNISIITTSTTTTNNQVRVDIYPQARLAGGRSEDSYIKR